MTSGIDAKPDDLRIVREALRGRLPTGATVVAFGSRAKWTAKEHSDLDICIRADSRIPRSVILDMKEALEDSDLPWRVDIVDWADLEPSFRNIIARDGVSLDFGSIPVSWTKAKWGDIVSLEYGKAIRGYQENTSGYRVFGTNGPVGWTEKPLASGPGIILGRKGAYRGVHFSHDPFFVIDTAYFVKPKSDLDMRWLYYAIIHHKLGEIDDGSPIPSTTRAAVYVRDVEVPPLPEQRAIAATLGALDDKIELNQKMNATLEAMARALFRDWFVDFGPTRAKLAGKAAYLSPDLWALFPDRLDDEGKPEGWEEKPLDEIAAFLNGLALQKFPGKGQADSLPVIKIAELRNGITANSNRAARNLPPQYFVQDGDFLFSWSGSLLAKFWTGGEGALNQHPFKITSDRYPTWFFSEWVQHHLEDFQIIAASKATTMGHIQRGHLKAAKTICPPANVIARLGEVVAPLIDGIIRNELESRTLAQTRDLLLPRLMSGEVRMKDAEQLLGEAT